MKTVSLATAWITIVDSASGGAAKPLRAYETLSPDSPLGPVVRSVSAARNAPCFEGLNASGNASRRPLGTTTSRPAPANAAASGPDRAPLTTMLLSPPFTSGISCETTPRATQENSSVARSSRKPAANSNFKTRTSCADPSTSVAGYVPASRSVKPSRIGAAPSPVAFIVTSSSRDPLAGPAPSFHRALRATRTVSSTSTKALSESAAYSIAEGHASVPAARAFIASARFRRPGCFSRNKRRARSNGGFAWSTATSNVCGRTSTSARTVAAGGGRSATPSSSTANRPWSASSNTRCATCAPIAKGKKATSTVKAAPPRARAAARAAPKAPGYLERRMRGNARAAALASIRISRTDAFA